MLRCSYVGIYIFTIVVPSPWVDPLIIMECPSLYHVSVFISQSVLSDRSIVTPPFFCFPSALNIFSHALIFSSYVSLDLKWISSREHIYEFCFVFIQPVYVFCLEQLIYLHLRRLHHIHGFEFFLVKVLSSFFPLLFSSLVKCPSLVLCLDCFFFFCLSIVFFGLHFLPGFDIAVSLSLSLPPYIYIYI